MKSAIHLGGVEVAEESFNDAARKAVNGDRTGRSRQRLLSVPARQLVLFVCTDNTECDDAGVDTPDPAPQCN